MLPPVPNHALFLVGSFRRPVAMLLLTALLSARLAWAAPSGEAPLVLRSAQQSASLIKYAPDQPDRPGLCREIMQAVQRADPGIGFSGLELHAPLARIERLLDLGEIDVFFCLLKTPEREQRWTYLPVPLYRIRYRAAQRVGDTTPLRTLQDLAAAGRRKPVVVARGTVLAHVLKEAGVPMAEAGSEREALKMLALERTDVVFGQDINLSNNIRDGGYRGVLRMAPTVFREDAQYAVVARQVPAEVQERLTRALQQLERKGQLKAIADRYR